MTIIEAIDQIDALKPNTFSYTEKLRWLSELEGVIVEEVVKTHVGGEDAVFSGFTDETPRETKLTAPVPYDEVYVRYLDAQIDYHNGENNRFNNSAALYNAAYTKFKNWYNRTHRPIGVRVKFF